jgi:uncharacterized protein (DUF1778 family)
MSRAIDRPRTTRKPAARAKPRKGGALKASAAVKTARLEARINPELRAMLQQAAELEGRKVTEFVTSALQEAARRTISAAHVLKLSIADQEIFATALIDPPAAAPALERAFARRRDLLAKT